MRAIQGRDIYRIPVMRTLESIFGVSGWVLDHSGAIQHRLNRRPRVLPIAADRQMVIIRDKKIVAADEHVVQLTLCSPHDHPLPAWHPGAHVDVFLPSGRKRQYSLCGDPDDRRRYRIAIRRIPDGGGGSVEMHDLQIGSALEISSPRNAFYLAVPGAGSPSTRLRFIAGGIGITPILPMLRLAENLGLDWTMLYTGRRRASLPFLDELAGYGDRVHVRTDDDHGVPAAEDLLAGVDERTAIYACGPPEMITTIYSGLPARAKTELHHERFSAPTIVEGTEFEIELARSGQTITVGATQSALAALLRYCPDVAYSCQQGFCGTCVQRVLDGTVQHRDRLLTDLQRANGEMLICVSRADDKRLVLDL